MTDETIYTYRITRKVRTGGSGCLACVLMLIGVACMLFIPWIIGLPVGFILIAFGFMVDTKTKLVSTCGHCGNEVAHTSILCPTCRADLAAEPRKGWFR